MVSEAPWKLVGDDRPEEFGATDRKVYGNRSPSARSDDDRRSRAETLQ